MQPVGVRESLAAQESEGTLAEVAQQQGGVVAVESHRTVKLTYKTCSSTTVVRRE